MSLTDNSTSAVAATRKRSAAKPKLPPALAAANREHQVETSLAPKQSRHHDAENVHGARAPPAVRLMDKHEILAITGTTYPTVWAWMRATPPKFPRSRVMGGKSVWLSTEVEAWIAALPRRPLKGDADAGVEA